MVSVNKLTVKDFLGMEIDVDVYDDYDERIGIAFVGPVKLTDEGKEEFGPVLNTTIELYNSDMAVLEVNDDEKVLEKLSTLFYGAAGYCSTTNYDKWFVEV